MITTRQLRYFVAIADARSFSLAAERLHVAQSALSRQIKLLEEAAGERLFDRGGREIELTDAGRVFYDDACKVLSGMDAMAGRAQQVARGESGTIRLLHSSSVPLTAALLAGLKTFLAPRPHVHVQVATASSEQQAADIDAGLCDVGLARAPVLRQYPDVETRVWFEERLVAVFAAGHPLAGEAMLPLSRLRDERFVALPHPQRGGLSWRVTQLCRDAGFFPQVAAVTSRKTSQLQLVAAGFGIAVVPEAMAAGAGPDLACVPLAEACSDVLLLHRRSPPPLASALIDTLMTLRR